ncbi:hypothetical protein BGLA2_1490005 [Burkholderia gladioli]|nr:hypothetical protein BGLA2_1490005 [Burkholderia gladioli]
MNGQVSVEADRGFGQAASFLTIGLRGTIVACAQLGAIPTQEKNHCCRQALIRDHTRGVGRAADPRRAAVR